MAHSHQVSTTLYFFCNPGIDNYQTGGNAACRNTSLNNSQRGTNMEIFLSTYSRSLLLSSLGLFMLTACAYQRPAGHWRLINASTIYFPAVELEDEAMDLNYEAVCKEAQDEIYAQLVRELPAKIAPLSLTTDKISNEMKSIFATLKIRINRCGIDVDQSGGSFSYYLTLPVEISLTQNGESLLDYNMNTYEQVNIDTPTPEFEFTFAEPVSRTLLLFSGKQLWIPDK